MLELLTAPAAEVMTSADLILRAQLRLEAGETEEDALIDELAATARHHVEKYARVGLLPQVHRLTLPFFPREPITLPLGPLRSVDAVRYTQANGALVELEVSGYRITRTGPLASVSPAFGQAWPASACDGAVQIDFAVGWDDAAAIPTPIKQAMRLEIAHLFLHREAVAQGGLAPIPMGVADLLAPYRVFS